MQVYLGELTAEDVSVELFAEASEEDTFCIQPMRIEQALAGAVNGFIYSIRIPATRPVSDYTPRIRPYHPTARYRWKQLVFSGLAREDSKSPDLLEAVLNMERNIPDTRCQKTKPAGKKMIGFLDNALRTSAKRWQQTWSAHYIKLADN